MASDPERKVPLTEHCAVSPNSCERDSPGDLMEQEVQSAALSTLEIITREAQVQEESGVASPRVHLRYFPSPGLEYRVQVEERLTI